MKKSAKPSAVLLGLIISFTGASVFADALDNWYWRNPLPSGGTLTSVAYGNGRFVAVGLNAPLVSTNGLDWVSGPALAGHLNSMLFGNNLFVAVGDSGVIQTSTDGLSWATHNSGTSAHLRSIAYQNGIYVVLGDGGKLLTSGNATNWVVQNPTNALGRVAGGNGVFVALDGGANVFHSTNGMDWSQQSVQGGLPQTFHNLVAFTGGQFLISSFNHINGGSIRQYFIFNSTNGLQWRTNGSPDGGGGNQGVSYQWFVFANGTYLGGPAAAPSYTSPVISSTDAQNWAVANASITNEDEALFYQANGAAFGGGRFVLVGNTGLILTSTNGLNWTKQNRGTFQNQLTGAAAGGGAKVVVGTGIPFVPGSIILCSTNGSPYVVQSTPVSTNEFSAVIYTNGGFTVVGKNGLILQSAGGEVWTQRNSGTANYLRGVAAGSGLLVAVGDTGTIQTSPSGSVWTSRNAGTSSRLSGVVFYNGQFVAVGNLGTVLTSPDGIAWTGQDSGQLGQLLSISRGATGFVAVGDNGTILTSPDGVTWTPRNSGTTNQLRSVSYGNGYYLAVGGAGVIPRTSVDGIDWVARGPVTLEADGKGVAFIDDRFVMVGSSGVIVESDNTATMPLSLALQRATNLARLNIFAPTGTSFRVQANTNIGTSNWNDVAEFLDAPGVTQWDDTNNLPRRFYRAVSP